MKFSISPESALPLRSKCIEECRRKSLMLPDVPIPINDSYALTVYQITHYSQLERIMSNHIYSSAYLLLHSKKNESEVHVDRVFNSLVKNSNIWELQKQPLDNCDIDEYVSRTVDKTIGGFGTSSSKVEQYKLFEDFAKRVYSQPDLKNLPISALISYLHDEPTAPNQFRTLGKHTIRRVINELGVAKTNRKSSKSRDIPRLNKVSADFVRRKEQYNT